MTDKPGLSSAAVIVAIVGFIALGAATLTMSGVARTLVLFGIALLLVSLVVGIVVQRRIRQKYPPVVFRRDDLSPASEMIESARLRLAAGDTAAFGFHPTIDPSGDAEGQIWLVAADDGVLGRVMIELALPDLPADVRSHPGLAVLVADGWQIESVKPQEWVILERTDLTDASGAVSSVVDAVAGLFDIPTESSWTCRAIA